MDLFSLKGIISCGPFHSLLASSPIRQKKALPVSQLYFNSFAFDHKHIAHTTQPFEHQTAAIILKGDNMSTKGSHVYEMSNTWH